MPISTAATHVAEMAKAPLVTPGIEVRSDRRRCRTLSHRWRRSSSRRRHRPRARGVSLRRGDRDARSPAAWCGRRGGKSEGEGQPAGDEEVEGELGHAQCLRNVMPASIALPCRRRCDRLRRPRRRRLADRSAAGRRSPCQRRAKHVAGSAGAAQLLAALRSVSSTGQRTLSSSRSISVQRVSRAG